MNTIKTGATPNFKEFLITSNGTCASECDVVLGRYCEILANIHSTLYAYAYTKQWKGENFGKVRTLEKIMIESYLGPTGMQPSPLN